LQEILQKSNESKRSRNFARKVARKAARNTRFRVYNASGRIAKPPENTPGQQKTRGYTTNSYILGALLPV
jgi:hypothetical protein